MRTIALVNQKGGVGKTTTTANLGMALSRAGKKVLLVDLDPQAHLTYGLGIQAHDLPHTVYDIMRGDAPAKEVLVERTGMMVLPASLDLSGADLELSGVAGREFLLREGLRSARGYDYILIDCPPSLGLLTLNALTTAKEVFVVTQAEYYALHGLAKLMETVETVQKRLNKKLSVTGIVVTQYDGRKKLCREVVERLRGHFGKRLFKTPIRDNVSLAEAPSHGQTIFEYRGKSHGAEDYTALAKEVVRGS
jgi:chromosome partitioning protein